MHGIPVGAPVSIPVRQQVSWVSDLQSQSPDKALQFADIVPGVSTSVLVGVVLFWPLPQSLNPQNQSADKVLQMGEIVYSVLPSFRIVIVKSIEPVSRQSPADGQNCAWCPSRFLGRYLGVKPPRRSEELTGCSRAYW